MSEPRIELSELETLSDKLKLPLRFVFDKYIAVINVILNIFYLFFVLFLSYSVLYAQSAVFPNQEQSRLLQAQTQLSTETMEDSSLLEYSGDLEGIVVHIKPLAPVFSLQDDIQLRIEIRNQAKTKASFRFRYSENPFQQIVLNIADREGAQPFKTSFYQTALYLQKNLTEVNTATMPLLKQRSRVVTLDYQQVFSMVVNASDYYDFQLDGVYYVSLQFFPLSIARQDYVINSVEAQFQIDRMRSPGLTGIDRDSGGQSTPYFLSSNRNLSKNGGASGVVANRILAPYEIVQKNIRDQQIKNWQEFLMAYDLEKLLKNSYTSTDYAERYAGALDLEKPIVVEDFSQFLIDSIDYEIQGIDLLKTTIIDDKAKVEVRISSVETYVSELEYFDPVTGQVEIEWIDLQGDLLERQRKFIYDLQLIDGEWKIVSIDTRVIDERIPDQAATLDVEQSTASRGNRVGDIYFEYNSFELNPDYLLLLDTLVQLIRDGEIASVLLVGYTDERGTDDYNLNLATFRVEAVRSYLLERGIAENKIMVDPRGEIKIAEGALSEEQRSRNRRVEVYLTK